MFTRGFAVMPAAGLPKAHCFISEHVSHEQGGVGAGVGTGVGDGVGAGVGGVGAGVGIGVGGVGAGVGFMPAPLLT